MCVYESFINIQYRQKIQTTKKNWKKNINKFSSAEFVSDKRMHS